MVKVIEMKVGNRGLKFYIDHDIVSGMVIMQWTMGAHAIRGINPPEAGWKDHCSLARQLKNALIEDSKKQN